MYYAIVANLMFVFPLLSIAVEVSVSAVAVSASLVGKWFVFWSVGWRLFLAGARQIAQPEYTARAILGLKSSESNVLVRELGFGNVALGVIGIASLWLPSWRLAAALAGGLFYGMAGITHVLQPHRNRLESIAMVSDLFASVVLLGVCLAAAMGQYGSVQVRPNASLERTLTGKAAWAFPGQPFHCPVQSRSALPVRSAQLKR